MDFTPHLNPAAKEPLYVQLYHFFKEEIRSGRISAGEKLPSKRKLALHLNISLNTVNAAYEQLIMEGYLHTRPKSGVYASLRQQDLHTEHLHPLTAEPPPVSETEDIRFDFSHGKIDLGSFPYSIWRRLTQELIYDDQAELLHSGDVQGESLLREQIAKYIYQSRGVQALSEQIVIGAGTQYLLWLLSMILGKGQVMGFENPGYHRAKITFEHSGLLTVPIELDEHGIDVLQLEKSPANHVYVTPSHQFPYGMIMPISRRLELLQWAQRNNGYIIEDDYDGEFRYKGKPIPSLQGLDTLHRVIYLGTFSKSLIPSIRLNFMVLPPELLEIYQKEFTIYKQTVSRLHQQTLYLFMKKGHWETHLNRMRTLYRKKQQKLLTSVQFFMGQNVKIIGEQSGLHILLRVNTAMPEEVLVLKAMEAGVKVYPSSVYKEGLKTDCPEILLGFGGLTEQEIKKGIEMLASAWFGVS
ncbi:PLP-dependent aminotransferase family protein [Heyndrickxia acidicola]|uniref:PLP-dependent aminotransferase family protein n=1 Tax=Heyndrickxia acidicola TaxID=209389 RepID=A0ABU6MBH1_9BACI|nr:PLP-dependent aminotransferase family protein [Heyndrickxia acidicola]MED1201860.1 PLP-dependent aminotransferase family protein [Heyndrickxia acidicola]